MDDRTVLSVSDNGIAPEYHDKVFQVLQRLHAERIRGHGSWAGDGDEDRAGDERNSASALHTKGTFQVSLPKAITD